MEEDPQEIPKYKISSENEIKTVIDELQNNNS